MATIIKLPKIICGQVIYDNHEAGHEVLKYSGNVEVHIPKVTDADIKKIIENRERLHHLSLAEVSSYLSKGGYRLLEPENESKSRAIKNGSIVTGYSEPMFFRDYFIMGEYTANRNVLYDLLEAELGDFHMVDEWVRNQLARVKAFPRGRVFHVLVGNVPIASMYSILRSILTKNQTVVKIPSRDPVSALFYLQTLIEANPPGHPISRSLSAVYFKRTSNYMNVLTHSADMVCAWGKGETLEAVKKKVPHSIPYLELGPKRSYALLFSEETQDLESAALRLSHDISIYDQEACFNVQRLFVIGDHKKFIPLLQKYMDVHLDSLPKGKTSPDAESHIFRIGLEAKYRNWKISEGEGYKIIVADPYEVSEHPLGRTVFIHPINDIKEIIPFVDDENQAISIFPFEKHKEVADTLCPFGLQRISEMGQLNYPREGFTHDGMYPLHYFVRLAYIDESVKSVYKYAHKNQVKDYLYLTYGFPKMENFEEVLFESSDKLDW